VKSGEKVCRHVGLDPRNALLDLLHRIDHDRCHLRHFDRYSRVRFALDPELSKGPIGCSEVREPLRMRHQPATACISDPILPPSHPLDPPCSRDMRDRPIRPVLSAQPPRLQPLNSRLLAQPHDVHGAQLDLPSADGVASSQDLQRGSDEAGPDWHQ